jgi:hypothetical protein
MGQSASMTESVHPYHFVIAVWRAKKAESARMKYWQTTLAILAALSASIALAEDFKTIDGKEYKNATVSRVEADGITLKSKSGISKVYFTELPKEIQERFHYHPVQATTLQKQQEEATARSSRKPDATEPMAKSGIETLPLITVKLNDELLNALKMTDKLDVLYKRGCSSAEFVAAALPVESVFMNLQKKLPKSDPRHDLLVNTFEGYQSTAVAMKANERGKSERPDALFVAAGLRKHLLTKILEGNMTPEEKTVYYTWRKALGTNP